MDLDTQTLKECRLGPIVLFYTKTKRVATAINRQADALVSAWSRPIIKRPANFRSKHIDTMNGDGLSTPGEVEVMDIDGPDSQPVTYQPVKRTKFNTQQALAENQGRKGARILINRVSPRDSQGGDCDADMSRISNILWRLNHGKNTTRRICSMFRGYSRIIASLTSLRGRCRSGLDE